MSEAERFLDQKVRFPECSQDEPTLREIVVGYYAQHLGASAGQVSADRFFAELLSSVEESNDLKPR